MADTVNQYVPDYAIVPGETIADALEDLGMSQDSLAARTGHSSKMINQIVNGKAPISDETALQLERVLDIPASFWMNLERQYREARARITEAKAVANAPHALANFPIDEMARRKLIPAREEGAACVLALLRFFRVGSITQLRPDVAGALFRRATHLKSDEYALWTWLTEGEWRARDIPLQEYTPAAFRAVLRNLRALTVRPWGTVQDEVVRSCATAGVAVVFVPEYRGTCASGAARWITPNLPAIQLSYRYKREDGLWFSLFHEAGHLLRHGKKDTYISEPDILSDTLEEEADAFARDTLIPPGSWMKFIEGRRFGEAAIVEAAATWEIDPGIVVGRLKKEKYLPYDRFGHLQRKIAMPQVP